MFIISSAHTAIYSNSIALHSFSLGFQIQMTFKKSASPVSGLFPVNFFVSVTPLHSP